MVNISKNKIDRYMQDKLFNLFFEIFSVKRNQNDLKTIFISLFSYTERLMIIKRLGLIYLLLRGFRKCDICKLIKVSTATLDKYKLILDKNINIYNYFKKFILKENISNLFEELF